MVAELEPEDPRKVGPYLLLGRLGAAVWAGYTWVARVAAGMSL